MSTQRIRRKNGYTNTENRILRLHHDALYKVLDGIAYDLDTPLQYVFEAWLQSIDIHVDEVVIRAILYSIDDK